MMKHISPTDLIDILDRCAEFLDNHIDAAYDWDRIPKRAISLKADVEAARLGLAAAVFSELELNPRK